MTLKLGLNLLLKLAQQRLPQNNLFSQPSTIVCISTKYLQSEFQVITISKLFQNLYVRACVYSMKFFPFRSSHSHHSYKSVMEKKYFLSLVFWLWKRKIYILFETNSKIQYKWNKEMQGKIGNKWEERGGEGDVVKILKE